MIPKFGGRTSGSESHEVHESCGPLIPEIRESEFLGRDTRASVAAPFGVPGRSTERDEALGQRTAPILSETAGAGSPA